ncbi:hypothetical protein MBLNU457_g0372t1 [Dothideomycetes sp. NU457]
MTDQNHLHEFQYSAPIVPDPQIAVNEQDVDPSLWTSQDDPSSSTNPNLDHEQDASQPASTDTQVTAQDDTPSLVNDTTRRYRAPHTEEDTRKLEELLLSGLRPLEIRKALPHISKSNIYLKYNKFRKIGTSIADKTTYRKTGRPKILSETLEDFISVLLLDKPGLELAQIAEVLKTEKGIECSTTSVSRAIARIQGPRGRGLKSRRLGQLKREKLERQGVLGDGGVWRGRTGVVYAKGVSQETVGLGSAGLVHEHDSQPAQNETPKTASVADHTGPRSASQLPIESSSHDDDIALDPQLRSSPTNAVTAQIPQQDIYESSYLPMHHQSIDPADLSAIKSLVSQRRNTEE